MFCQNCGTEVADGTKFCPNCGKAVGENVNQGNPTHESANHVSNDISPLRPNSTPYIIWAVISICPFIAMFLPFVTLQEGYSVSAFKLLGLLQRYSVQDLFPVRNGAELVPTSTSLFSLLLLAAILVAIVNFIAVLLSIKREIQADETIVSICSVAEVIIFMYFSISFYSIGTQGGLVRVGAGFYIFVIWVAINLWLYFQFMLFEGYYKVALESPVDEHNSRREESEMDNNYNNEDYNGYDEYDYYDVPEEYRPISMWGYFGYEILFSIPVIGFILLIVFSFTARNQNLKNFARSYFCIDIIIIVLVAILVATGAFGGLYSDFVRM